MVVFPLFIFDGQLLFGYGIFQNNHICQDIRTNEIRQLRRALKYPITIRKSSPDIPVRYFTPWIPTPSKTINKGYICFLWNISDITIYALIPFVITLICSLIIILQVCQRRRSTTDLGGQRHRNRDVTIASGDHLSTLLISTNVLYLFMTAPFNICLTIQSLFECFFLESSGEWREFFEFIGGYLRLLQNSYHALTFLFYCVIGNKFRSSAKSICRRIYAQFLECGLADRCAEQSVGRCCLDRRRSSSSGQTASTNSRLSDRRLTLETRPTTSIPLQVLRRPTLVTFDLGQKSRSMYQCAQV